MPGGGAEIFSSRLAKELRYTGKADADRWCEIHGIAHSLGIRTNATMLYGHVETLAERVDHLLRLREQQDRSGGFLTFIAAALSGGRDQARAAIDATGRQPPHDRRRPPAARQLPAHRGVLGAPRRGDGVDRAALRRRRRERHARGRARSSTWRARRPRRASRASSSSASSATPDKMPVERDALYNVVRVWDREGVAA